MASAPQKPPRPAPRLYLVTPEVADADAFARVLAPMLGATDIAAVLLRLAPAGESALVKTVKALAPVIQNAGAALILDGHAEIVGRAGADGAHLTGIAAFTAAVGGLKPQRIAGAGGLTTRHDAMLAAEAGVDYVLFGGKDADGREASFDFVRERTAWWGELIETPCVALAASIAEIAALVDAGGDFIAVGDCIWNDPRGPSAALAAATSALASRETVA